MLCRELTLAGTFGNEVKLAPLHCRSWTCEICFPGRLRGLKDIAAAGHPNKMLTLTVDPAHWPNPYEAAQRLIESWRLIRQQARREHKADKIEFLAVLELTKRGTPHLHILLRSPYLDQAWISREMHRHMRSPICWIDAIKSTRQAVRYVAKYCSKGPARIGTCKRFFRSRGYADPNALQQRERDPRWSWQVLDLSPTEAILAFQICDWDHRWIDDNTLLCTRRDGSRWPYAARPPPWRSKRE